MTLVQPDEEAAVLGTLIDQPHSIKSVADILRPEHFYREFHRHIYESCQSLYRDGIEIDNISVADRYLRLGGRDFPGIRSAIAGLMESALPTSSLTRHHAQIIIDRYKRRKAIVVYKEGLNSLEDLSKPINSILAEGTERLFALGGEGSEGGMVALGEEALPEALERAEKARKGGGSDRVVPYRWDALTRLSPLRRGEVTVVCGRPGMAKTSFALNTAVTVARKGIPVGIFSLEMNKASLTFRLMSLISGVDSRRIERGETSGHEHKRVTEAVKQLGSLPIVIDDSGDLDEISFMSKSREAHQRFGLGLIILDYLTLMTRQKNESPVIAVGSCARTVRKTARILDIPVIEVCQVSRSCEYRDDKRPILSDLRESGEIEQEADIVLALYRDDYYNKNSPEQGMCEIIVLKHRNGGIGHVKLVFEAESTRFDNEESRQDLTDFELETAALYSTEVEVMRKYSEVD